MSFVMIPKTFQIILPCLHVVLFENIIFWHFFFRNPNELYCSDFLFFTHLLGCANSLYHPRIPTTRGSWPKPIACYFFFGKFIFQCRYIDDLFGKHLSIFLHANNFFVTNVRKKNKLKNIKKTTKKMEKKKKKSWILWLSYFFWYVCNFDCRT